MSTQKQKIEKYERLLHLIQMHREVTMDASQVRQLLDNICAWSYAHRRGNGELTEAEQKRLITSKFNKLTDTEETINSVHRDTTCVHGNDVSEF